MTLQEEIVAEMKKYLPAEVIGNIESAADAAVDVVERRLLSAIPLGADAMARNRGHTKADCIDITDANYVIRKAWQAVKDGNDD